MCAAWTAARGERDYFRLSKDRPVAAGSDPNPVWQLKQMQRYLPGSVAVIDMVPRVSNTPQKNCSLFTQYLEAVEQAPGSLIMPMLDIMQPREASQQEREDATYAFFGYMLTAYAENPGWFRVDGVPVVNDYGAGGMTTEGLGRVYGRLRAEGLKFFAITDIGELQFALSGRVDMGKLSVATGHMSGIYTFGPPVHEKDGGFALLAELVRQNREPRILGISCAPGYYSARAAMRNLVAAIGTQQLRRNLESAVAVKADLLSPQTWNDYVENAHFEPSYNRTSALLEIVRHYADQRLGLPHASDTQPHIFASYRRALFAGEKLKIEILNLPVESPFGELIGDVVLRDAAGMGVARLPFRVHGDRLSATEVQWQTRTEWKHEMLDVQVEVVASGSIPFRRVYRNLPPVPVHQDGLLEDPLDFNVPLHRLYTDRLVEITLNGAARTVSAPFPRVLNIASAHHPAIAGVSYMRSGAIINDPVPATASSPVLDNIADDPSRFAPPASDYYGGLVQFQDDRLAYARGTWCADPDAGRIWADYRFQPDIMYYNHDEQMQPVRRLWDRSGHGYHGRMTHCANHKGEDDADRAPQWIPLRIADQPEAEPELDVQPLFAALHFDGVSSAVDLPGMFGIPGGPMTIELMVKPRSVETGQAIFAAGGENINVLIDADGCVRVRHCNTARQFDDVVSTAPLVAGRWTAIIATYDMVHLRLFIDGTLAGEIATDGLRTNEGARLGAPFWSAVDPRRGPWGAYEGMIARLRVLTGASTPADIVLCSSALQRVFAHLIESTGSLS